MKTFLCRSPDIDGDEWRPVEAWDAEDAAADYAETLDSDSGGEMFTDPRRHEHDILVKEGDGEPETFVVYFDYSKVFMARPKA